jgi:hypothetical protein
MIVELYGGETKPEMGLKAGKPKKTAVEKRYGRV